MEWVVRRCPRCGLDRVREVRYIGFMCLVCSNCGYDEREMYEIVPDDKFRKRSG